MLSLSTQNQHYAISMWTSGLRVYTGMLGLQELMLHSKCLNYKELYLNYLSSSSFFPIRRNEATEIVTIGHNVKAFRKLCMKEFCHSENLIKPC